MRPETLILPWVGRLMPQMSCKSVVLPVPLRPIMPQVSPRRTSKLTSRNTQ